MDRGIYKTCLECVDKLFANILRLDFKSVEKVSIRDLEIDCDCEVLESIRTKYIPSLTSCSKYSRNYFLFILLFLWYIEF